MRLASASRPRPRRSKWRLPRALLSASLLLARVAHAEPQTELDLSWTAPAGCPQQRAVRDRVRALAGPLTRRDATPRVEGEVTRVGGRFRLRLVVRDGKLSGERTIESDSCKDLVGAAAIAITLLMRSGEPPTESKPPQNASQRDAGPHDTGPRDANVNQDTNSRGSETPSGSKSASEATNEARPAPTPAPVESSAPERIPPVSPDGTRDAARENTARNAASERSWRVLLVAPLATLGFGLLPSPSFGLGAAAGLSYERWRIRIGGQFFVPQTVQADGLLDYAVKVRRATGGVTVCRELGQSRFELSPCFGVSAERLTARGLGAHIVSSDQHATWLSLGPGATGRWKVLAALSLMLELGLQIETARPSLAIGGLGDQRLGPVALSAGLGSEWIF
jgi:hypothetical protein